MFLPAQRKLRSLSGVKRAKFPPFHFKSAMDLPIFQFKLDHSSRSTCICISYKRSARDVKEILVMVLVFVGNSATVVLSLTQVDKISLADTPELRNS